MSDTEHTRKEEIEALLAERKKYEAWLAQLESRRASAAEHVFTRVYSDYSGRLEEVRGKLGERAEALESMVADLEKRLGHEQDKISAKTDERAEAELRAMVGEFEDKEWENTRSRLDSSIRSLRARFDGTERELADLKGLLISVRGTSAPARPSMMQAAAGTVDEALEQSADPDEVVAALQSEPIADTADGAGTVEANESRVALPNLHTETAPAEQNAPTEPVMEQAVAPEPEVAAPTPEPEPVRAPTPFDELAFLKSVAATPTAPRGNPAVTLDAQAAPDAGDEPAARPRTSSSKTVESEPAPLGSPTPRTSQAIRSLKCGECGTLNFPTEWYCERCGGELAAF
jgi:predicted  nucleic acid-binding Zn-ribbon protein